MVVGVSGVYCSFAPRMLGGVVVLSCLLMSPPGRVLSMMVGVVVFWPPPRFAGVSLGPDVAC